MVGGPRVKIGVKIGKIRYLHKKSRIGAEP